MLVKFSSSSSAYEVSAEELCVLSVMATTFTRMSPRGQGVDLPVPVQPQHAVDIRVAPSPPSDAGLSPPLASHQKCRALREGTIGIADPEVVDPAGHGCLDAVDNYRHGGTPPLDVPYLGPDTP